MSRLCKDFLTTICYVSFYKLTLVTIKCLSISNHKEYFTDYFYWFEGEESTEECGAAQCQLQDENGPHLARLRGREEGQICPGAPPSPSAKQLLPPETLTQPSSSHPLSLSDVSVPTNSRVTPPLCLSIPGGGMESSSLLVESENRSLCLLPV